MQLVTKLRMLDKGTAVVSWRLRGRIALVPVDVNLETEFDLDLITGRVRLLALPGVRGTVGAASQDCSSVDCNDLLHAGAMQKIRLCNEA